MELKVQVGVRQLKELKMVNSLKLFMVAAEIFIDILTEIFIEILTEIFKAKASLVVYYLGFSVN